VVRTTLLSIGRLWLLALAGAMLLATGVSSAQSTADVYRLGPGDLIDVSVFGEQDLSIQARLDDSGAIDYPLLGTLSAKGLTAEELSARITSGLKGPYLINPRVTVAVSEYRPFFVNGEVERPGSFPYQPGLTLQQAITLAGGFTERAAQRRVEVIRTDDPSRTAKVIEMSDPVNAGDVVTVPQSFF
jgi:polysaccharide biosynthesis/export protein VpsN